MAHFLISLLCWLGLAIILGNIAKKYICASEEEKDSFTFIMLNGCGAAIVFVPLLGIVLAILSSLIPSLEGSVDLFFDTLSPFGLSKD